MNVAVLGAGAWGTAISRAATARHAVLLYARDSAQADAIRRDRENSRYLPGVVLAAHLEVTSRLEDAVAHARDGLLIIATPTDALRGVLRALPACSGSMSIVWLCKGFEKASSRLAHEVVQEVMGPQVLAGPLSGPSFAQEVAAGLPTALTVAGAAPFCERVTEALHGGALRIYSSDDIIGVEVGGAVKNVLAIATGICDALELGLNARAALITRGLAEMTRLGCALGAKPDTFMGLTGVGDLILTATGDLSRNRRIGLELGRGVSKEAALAKLGHVAEGVHSAHAVRARARAAGVEMPITEAVCAVLDGALSPPQALDRLLAREPRREALQP
ncbi:MAG TPA: NAD(P)H-dependent glycerol-3-phosphate dehydrogenase [Burkholderiaceae bacterium]|nr:NAD(P)H-dependent glycerol-3-phosphate dehydrogenase [Burkholderiaceae bacterium]